MPTTHSFDIGCVTCGELRGDHQTHMSGRIRCPRPSGGFSTRNVFSPVAPPVTASVSFNDMCLTCNERRGAHYGGRGDECPTAEPHRRRPEGERIYSTGFAASPTPEPAPVAPYAWLDVDRTRIWCHRAECNARRSATATPVAFRDELCRNTTSESATQGCYESCWHCGTTLIAHSPEFHGFCNCGDGCEADACLACAQEHEHDDEDEDERATGCRCDHCAASAEFIEAHPDGHVSGVAVLMTDHEVPNMSDEDIAAYLAVFDGPGELADE